MPSPVLPSDAKAIIPDPSSSLCGNFVNALLKLPLLFYQFLNWLLDADGNLSTEVQKSVTTLTTKPGDAIFSFGLLNTDGRLLCDGQAYSRDTYADLFAAIGTTYGAGNGTTTFNVPDCRDRFPVGVSGTKTVSTTGGEEAHVLTKPEMPTHSHGFRITLAGGGGSASGFGDTNLVGIGGRSSGATVVDQAEGSTSGFSANNAAAGFPIFNNGSGTAHNNLPPYIAVYTYIKT